MQGFKNLLRTNQITEQSYQNFLKRVEEFRKIARGPLKKCQGMIQNHDTWFITIQKLVFDFHLGEDESFKQQNLSKYLIKFCEKLLLVQKQFVVKLGGRYNQVRNECNDCLRLQSEFYQFLMLKIREYKIKQQAILESYRKYIKLYKSMLINIQTYKKTFTDVKIIYNKDEKIRIYGICQANYEEALTQYENIQVKLNQIIDEQKGIVGLTQKMVKEFENNIVFAAQQAKYFTNTFLQLLYAKQFNQINAINLVIEQISKSQPSVHFDYQLSETQSEQLLSGTKERKKSAFIPSLIINIHEVKDENLPQVGGVLTIIEKQLTEIIKKRKSRNKQILQFIGLFLKNYQKSIHSHKQILARYNKKKKKFIQYFFIPSVFSSSFVSILEQIQQIQQKNLKQFPLKLKNIETVMNDQTKIIEQMQRQFTKYTQKLVNKKDLKKRQSFQKGGIQLQSQLKKIDEQIKLQIHERVNNVKVIFQQYQDRLKKNATQLKNQWESILSFFQKFSIQIYTIIKKSVELKLQETKTNKIIEKEAQQLSKVASNFFQQTIFACLNNEQFMKPSFEAQLYKIEQFKKLKKPIEIIQQQKAEKGEDNDSKRRECVKWKQMAYQTENATSPKEMKIENQKENQNEVVQQKRNKYESFLKTKITYLVNQQFCESYKCGLAYNIILSGRLFVTNQRLCFHSKLNSKNLFFGETFIEIPKKDILKIQKRQNAVVFDNSISISTINGEMFFTSFFSRNEAYNTICSAFDISLNDVMYEQQQEVIQNAVQQMITEQEDDLKEDEISERVNKINQIIKKRQYKEAISTVFQFKNLNALKYLKMFELNQQISYNRAKYRGFNHYFKSLLGHTEINLEEWNPNIQEYLNSSNIKSNTPLVFTKKNTSVVPVPTSGIPFMPKTSKVQETITMYIVSKDKIIIQMTVKSFGVPYCDYFVINYKKEIETIAQNKISFKFWYNINFTAQTMMKGVIENKSFQQTKMSIKKVEEEMNKYLKYSQRKISYSTKCESGNQIEISSSQHLGSNEVDDQVKQLKEENEKLIVSLGVERGNNIKLRRMLLVSVLINIGLILLMLI